jgi:hypothetical protein
MRNALRIAAIFTWCAFFADPVAASELLKVPSNSQKGFQWAYYIYIPDTIKRPAVVLVEPNNTGITSDDPGVHDASAYNQTLGRRMWADQLGSPYLVPTFPRPATYWSVYTHALDRDTLTTQAPGLVRIDLQLMAMIADARELLSSKGIVSDPKVWMLGASASGSFVNRFTMLHPEAVKAASIGTPGSYPIVPVTVWKGKPLPYPVGVADLMQLTGKSFDAETFRRIPLQIYIGDQDLDDAVAYPDGYEDSDRVLIKSLFGGPPPYLRWPGAEAAYTSIQSSSQFVVFPGMGHQYADWAYIREFFERNRLEPFPASLTKPRLHKLYFPHIAGFASWRTQIGLTNTSEVDVNGELQAFTAEGSGLQSIPVNIPRNGRREIRVESFFSNAAAVAYAVFVSDSGFIAGYTRFEHPGNRASLPAAAAVEQGWFVKVETDGWTGVAFLNAEAEEATVRLAAVDLNGKLVAEETLQLKPGVKTVGMINELFHVGIANAKYVRFSSNRKIIAFSVSGSGDGLMLDALTTAGRYIK